jgi:hypothetical protein
VSQVGIPAVTSLKREESSYANTPVETVKQNKVIPTAVNLKRETEQKARTPIRKDPIPADRAGRRNEAKKHCGAIGNLM